jgi:hypothetical protein
MTTTAEKTAVVHVWEAQGLGDAPFKCVGCRDLGATCGACDACNTPIRYEFEIEARDGRRFVVGSDCVEKTGDWGLVKYIKPLKAAMVKKAARKAKAEKARKAFEDSLCNEPRGEITVKRLGKDVSFESPFSDPEAIAIVAGLESKFAKSLTADLAKWNRLFPRQLDWCHKLAVDAVTPKPKKEAIDLGGSWTAVLGLFDTAGAKLKYPKITFECEGETIQLSRAGSRARYPGSINVTDGGPYGDNVWYGRVRDGAYEPSKSATPKIREFLAAFAADPGKFAGDYGKRHGCCCFCRAELTEPRSRYAGYGPTCAKNYKLPYLKVSEWKKLTDAERAPFEGKDAGEAVAAHTGEKFDDALKF